MAEKITIQLFGSLVDLAKSPTLELDEVSDTNTLKEQLILIFPMLASKEFAIAIDQKIIHSNTVINTQTEIALLPPFSGG
jgi:molybdopterin synthase sulfur carrier subunit